MNPSQELFYAHSCASQAFYLTSHKVIYRHEEQPDLYFYTADVPMEFFFFQSLAHVNELEPIGQLDDQDQAELSELIHLDQLVDPYGLAVVCINQACAGEIILVYSEVATVDQFFFCIALDTLEHHLTPEAVSCLIAQHKSSKTSIEHPLLIDPLKKEHEHE